MSVDRKRLKTPFMIEQPEDTEHLNMIIYGDMGVGKTYLCGTAMDFEGTTPALFIDFEGGTRTLRGRKIDVVRPKNWKDIQEIYEFFLYKNTYYKCVIIDPLTELQKKHSMGYVMGEVTDHGNSNHYSDLGKAVAPSIQDWLRSSEQMRKVIRAFRDLAYLEDKSRRVHVIMTALEKYDEKKGVVCPQLPGALGLECGAMVDILVRLSKQSIEVEDPETGDVTREIRRHLLTEDYIDDTGTKYMAKNRGDELGLQVWNPTIKKILGVKTRKLSAEAKSEEIKSEEISE